MKKLISLILVVVSLLLLPSCNKDKSYDEAEVKSAAKNLIRDAATYNDIFWGEGFPYIEDINYSNGIYYAADEVYLKKIGFSKLDDIYIKASNIFSEAYLESIYSGMNTSGNVRYYQEKERIMVNSEYEPLLTDKVSYLYDTIEILGYDGDVLELKITVKVTRGEDTQTREKKIDLVKEGGKWLIDSPTYISYRPDGTEK